MSICLVLLWYYDLILFLISVCKSFYISIPNLYFFFLPTVFGNHVHTTFSVTAASYRMWHKDACFTCPFLCDWKSKHAGNFVVKHENRC